MTELLGILGPVFIITAIGGLFGKSSVGLHTRTLSTLVLLVATPSLVFHTLVSMHISLGTMGRMALAAVACIAVSGVIGFCFLKLARARVRLFLPSLMLPNSGNLGLPLAALAFGEEGLKLGVSYFFIVALFQYSVGMMIASGSMDLRSFLKQPLLISVIIVLCVTGFDITLPEVVMTTTEILGGMMVPCMLILLGSSLATLDVSDMKAALWAAGGRLVLGLISALVVIWSFGLTGLAAGVVFLLAVMPSAIVTFVFAERYQKDAGAVAGAVVMSTVVTFLCMPGLIWIALRFAATATP
jgi:malate permease and related proteins